MSLIIPGRDITRQRMLQSIQAYIGTQPDFVAWKDFFQSGTGKLLLDILVGINELLIYKTEARNRNSYIYTTDTTSAAFLLAQMLGYNPNRKLHAVGKVKAEISGTGATSAFTIPNKLQLPFATPITINGNYQVNPGDKVVTEIEVWQGEWVETEFSTPLLNLQGIPWENLFLTEFNFQVDQYNIIVNVNGIDYTLSGNLFGGNVYRLIDKAELVDAYSIIVRTDHQGGVILMFGDGTYGPLLTTSSVVTVKYLRTNGSLTQILRGAVLGETLIGGHIVKFTVTEPIRGGTDQDSIDKIRFVASRFFQTGGRAVTKYDYEATALSYAGVISSKVELADEECCTLDVCPLKQNAAPWNQAQIAAFLSYMDTYKMATTKLVFVHPVAVTLTATVEIVMRSGPVESEVTLQVRAIFEQYANRLGVSFRSTKVVDLINNLSPFILRVYVRDVTAVGKVGYIDRDDYPDIPLDFYEYFAVGNLNVLFSLKISEFDD